MNDDYEVAACSRVDASSQTHSELLVPLGSTVLSSLGRALIRRDPSVLDPLWSLMPFPYPMVCLCFSLFWRDTLTPPPPFIVSSETFHRQTLSLLGVWKVCSFFRCCHHTHQLIGWVCRSPNANIIYSNIPIICDDVAESAITIIHNGSSSRFPLLDLAIPDICGTAADVSWCGMVLCSISCWQFQLWQYGDG